MNFTIIAKKKLNYCGGGAIFEFKSFDDEHRLKINHRNGDQLKESLNRAKKIM